MKQLWLLTLATILLLALTSPLLGEGTVAAPGALPAAPLTDLLCSAPQAPAAQAAPGKIDAATNCIAIASCENGSTISCSGSGTCIAVDQNCAQGIRGYVECSNSEAQCPPCPIDCTGYPPRGKCIEGLPCKPGCNNCGDGTCWHGTCNCLI